MGSPGRRKSWADRERIPTGVFGEICNGVTIKEENRATGWEFRRDGIEVLLKIAKESYIKKGIKAVVFGVDGDGKTAIRYAVFVQDGFLVPIDDNE
jgi:hypothetical protein